MLADVGGPGSDVVRESIPHLLWAGGCGCGCPSFNVRDSRFPGLLHLVPVALERLALDPLVAGDFYPGELLVAVLRVGDEFWLPHPDDRRALREIVAGLDVAPAEPAVTDALRAIERAGS